MTRDSPQRSETATDSLDHWVGPLELSWSWFGGDHLEGRTVSRGGAGREYFTMLDGRLSHGQSMPR